MRIALITLSAAGARLLAPLTKALPETRLYVHDTVPDEALIPGIPGNGKVGPAPDGPGEKTPQREELEKGGTACDRVGFPAAVRFTKITALTAELFPVCRGLVYAAPCGVVVRALAPLITNKYQDPAVVVLDAGGRWAVSLLSGHEGGANALALQVANLVGAEPVISTTTEALKDVIVGIGCRRGTPAERIVTVIRDTLGEAGIGLDEVRLLASADIKADEMGLLAAAKTLDIPIRFIPAAEIRHSSRDFSHSDFVEGKVALPAVAEPAVLLAGRRTRLILRKKIVDGITIALAREGFPSQFVS